MAQGTDLYSILRAYANKNNSPYIIIDTFISFLKQYAERKVPEQPEWEKWTSETEVKFWGELSKLVESDRCALMADTPEGRIYMPFYTADRLQDLYKDIDNTANLPLPNEDSLGGGIIPEGQVRIINLGLDAGSLFEQSEDAENAGNGGRDKPRQDQIVKIIFPNDFGSVLALPSMIPHRLMEASLLKIRYFLRNRGNKDYVLHKLNPQLQGKEKYLREILDQLMVRPMDCFRNMESSEDFAYLFWTFFCSMVKNDIKKKQDLLGEDLAVIQAVYIIDTCNAFYKARAIKKRELEIAFRNLELRLGKPPYYYTMDDIIKFTTDKGIPLLGMYTREQLDAYIKKNIAAGRDNGLPELLTLQGKKGEFWYIRKEKYLPLCAKLLVDTRPLIKKAMVKRWVKLIKDFRSEPAMEKDAEFEKMLAAYTAQLNPVLTVLLPDQKLQWVYEELEQTQGGIPPSSRIFRSGKLIPLSTLYAISRKNMLTDAKILLPFWYSIPVITGIIAFFKGLGKNKKPKKAEMSTESAEPAAETPVSNEARKIQSAARAIGVALVPPGKTLDGYLTELEDRWGRLLDTQAQQNLVFDVQSLVRDKLRQTVKIHKSRKVTRDGLTELADLLISHSPALQSIGSQESLRLYMELYMVKLLINVRL